MASLTGKMFLQLKDIIEIIAPSDLDLHKKKYVIDYIDTYVIRLCVLRFVLLITLCMSIMYSGFLYVISSENINIYIRVYISIQLL